MAKDTDFIPPDLKPEPHIEALRADDEGGLGWRVEEDVVRIEVAELDGPLAIRYFPPGALVEVKTDAERPFLRRQRRRLGEAALGLGGDRGGRRRHGFR